MDDYKISDQIVGGWVADIIGQAHLETLRPVFLVIGLLWATLVVPLVIFAVGFDVSIAG